MAKFMAYLFFYSSGVTRTPLGWKFKNSSDIFQLAKHVKRE